MLDITIIPKEVKKLATKFAGVTTAISTALASNEAIDIEKLIPGGTTLAAGLQGLCATAIKGCNSLIAAVDTTGVKARLQRLGADLTAMEHASDRHSISFYITSFETVFADLFGAAPAPASTATEAQA